MKVLSSLTARFNFTIVRFEYKLTNRASSSFVKDVSVYT